MWLKGSSLLLVAPYTKSFWRAAEMCSLHFLFMLRNWSALQAWKRLETGAEGREVKFLHMEISQCFSFVEQNIKNILTYNFNLQRHLDKQHACARLADRSTCEVTPAKQLEWLEWGWSDFAGGRSRSPLTPVTQGQLIDLIAQHFAEKHRCSVESPVFRQLVSSLWHVASTWPGERFPTTCTENIQKWKMV